MPYGFNDDKSKSTIPEIPEIKIIHVLFKNMSGGQVSQTIDAATLLSTYGITDIMEWSILGIEWKAAVGLDIMTPNLVSNNRVYPYAMKHYSDSSLRIVMFDDGVTNCTCDVILIHQVY